MGVSGLLPVLKSIQEPTTLERYRGKTLAIDTYAWLHKASFSCAEDLVLERPTKAYLNYFKKRIEMLKYFNITPYFVFDGDFLPRKGTTEKEREAKRDEFKKLANEAKSNNNPKLAFSYYQKACDISPEMAKSLINELKLKFIKYIVAPYEADSQMVMLEKLGLVDGIISEDSDLLIFGCKTLITKLDDKGQCIEIKRDHFKNVKGSYINIFTDDQLLLMAAISGCDYTKGIPGIGIQKAINLVKFYKTYDRVIMSIKVEGKNIPSTFDDEYKRAKIAFRHQIVFNPIENLAQHLNPLTNEILDNYTSEYIHSSTGFILDQEIHRKIAVGDLDPFTKNVLISWEKKVNATSTIRSNSFPSNSTTKTSSSLSSNSILSSSLFKRSQTENLNSIQSRSMESQPITKKRKSALRIDQFTNFIKTKKSSNSAGNNKLSPTAKRQKLLSFNDNKSEPGTMSQFFSHKKELNKTANKEENGFPATSSDTEDITEEDININDLNLRLNKSIKKIEDNQFKGNSTSQADSSDIVLSESDSESELDNKISSNDDNILKSESDMEDIIDSSEMSQSTMTMDRPFNQPTSTPIINEGNSISSNLSNSTDVGDFNTECFIEDERSNKTNTSNEELIVDKSNLLAEIYSFGGGNNRNATNKKKNDAFSGLSKVGNSNNSNNNAQFSPEKWILRNFNEPNKVHRPSPLQKRTPLRDVTSSSSLNISINNNNKKENGNSKKIQQQLKPNPAKTTTRPNLSSFRYAGN